MEQMVCKVLNHIHNQINIACSYHQNGKLKKLIIKRDSYGKISLLLHGWENCTASFKTIRQYQLT